MISKKCPRMRYIATTFFLYLQVCVQAQIPLWQELEQEWLKSGKPKIALQLAEELIDEQTNKSLFYVLEAQKKAKGEFENEILLLLTEIYIRKHKDKEAQEYYKKYQEKGDTLNPKYLYIKSLILNMQSQPAEAAELLGNYLAHINPKSVDEKSIAVLFLEYATNLMRIRNYEKSLSVLKQAEEIFKRLKMYKYLGRAYNISGLIYKNTFYYTLAIENFFKAIQTYKSRDFIGRNLAVSYLNLGNIYTVRPKDTSYFKEAKKMYEEGKNTCILMKDTVQLIHFYERLGSLSLACKQPQTAEKYYKSGLELAQKTGSSRLKKSLSIGIAAAYAGDGQIDTAINLLEKVIKDKDMEEKKNLQMAADAMKTLGVIYQNTGNHKKALEYLEKAARLAENAKLSLFQMLLYDYQVRSLIALQDLTAAKEKNEKMKTLAAGDRRWDLLVYHNQKMIDSVLGDYKTALMWASKYQLLKDSLENVEKIQSFNEVQQRFLAEEKEEENRLLRLQNELEKSKNTRNIYLIIVLVVFLMALFGSVVVWRLKDKKLSATNKRISHQEKMLKEYAEKLEKQNTILQEKNEFGEKIYSIISHDLRGPIYAVAALIENVYTEDFSVEELRYFMQLAYESLNGAGQLLDNLLFWAKSHQEGYQGRPKEVCVKEVADEVVGLLRLQAQQKGLFLENHIEPGTTCWAEKEAVHLIIRNIASNALKFTKKGGVFLNATHTENSCKIIISDTGIGISSENLTKIFGRGFSTSGTSSEKGSGLGLIITKEFIERSKGTISVSSKVGEGSVFTVTLPLPVSYQGGNTQQVAHSNT